MARLTQVIKNVVHKFNDWCDRYDQSMAEWRDTYPEAYFNYMITNKEVKKWQE